MPGDRNPNKTQEAAPTGESIGTRTRRFGIAILFSIVLLIPRLRRLRRRPASWLVFRILMGLGGAALIWRFARADGGVPSLVAGVILVLIAALVRARPERKTVDDVARELDALVVLNGGSCSVSDGTLREASIFVSPERLVVLTRAFERLAEIPLAGVREVITVPAGANGHRATEAWELRIDWDSDGRQAARFRYRGVFAEHLARVAGQTITSVWKKRLPVLRA